MDEHHVLNREFVFLTCHFVWNIQKVLHTLWIGVFSYLSRQKLMLVLDPNLYGYFISYHYLMPAISLSKKSWNQKWHFQHGDSICSVIFIGLYLIFCSKVWSQSPNGNKLKGLLLWWWWWLLLLLCHINSIGSSSAVLWRKWCKWTS